MREMLLLTLNRVVVDPQSDRCHQQEVQDIFHSTWSMDNPQVVVEEKDTQIKS
jgi:hypothetical protein